MKPTITNDLLLIESVLNGEQVSQFDFEDAVRRVAKTELTWVMNRAKNIARNRQK